MGESETWESLWRNNITSSSPHPFENPEQILVFSLPIHPAFPFISCRLLTFLTFSFRWPNFLLKLCRNPALWTPRVCSTTGSTALARQPRAPSVQWPQPWVSMSHTAPKGPLSAYLRKGRCCQTLFRVPLFWIVCIINYEIVVSHCFKTIKSSPSHLFFTRNSTTDTLFFVDLLLTLNGADLIVIKVEKAVVPYPELCTLKYPCF